MRSMPEIQEMQEIEQFQVSRFQEKWIVEWMYGASSCRDNRKVACHGVAGSCITKQLSRKGQLETGEKYW
jgi:hypothetical protein